MLPLETEIPVTVSQDNKPMLNSGRKAMPNNSIRQFANKAGNLFVKNPFWVLVLGSLGIHAIFALVPVSPVKKAEPPTEIKTATLPVVQLPPQSNRNVSNRNIANGAFPNANASKSFFDNLFVQPSPNKLGTLPNNALNSSPNSLQNTVPSPFDLSSFDRLEDFPPLITNLPDVPPISNNFGIEPSREFVKSRIPSPLTIPSSQSSRLNPSGQIDNSTPLKTANNSSNLRPEFQTNSGLRDTPSSQPSEPKPSKTPDLTPKNLRPSAPSNPPINQPVSQPINQPVSQPINQPAIDPNIKQSENIASIYTDNRITELLTQDKIEQTKIVPNPKDAVESKISQKIEDVDWIPPKGNFSGKSGTVIFVWLVDPTGKVEFQRYTLKGDRELVEIVAQTAKDYRFKPTQGSDKYRFITAKYEFPSK